MTDNMSGGGNTLIRHKILTALALIIAIQSMLTINVSAYTTYTPQQQGAYTFGKDQFDLEYALGYVNIRNTTPQPTGNFDVRENYAWYLPGTTYHFSNTYKDYNKYLDHYSQAYYKNEVYDIREYVWVNKQTGIIHAGTGANAARCTSAIYDNCVYREFHFYKQGTLATSNPVEVQFKGIMQFTDLDTGEGYTVNNVHRAFLAEGTQVIKTGTNTWKGTYEGNEDYPQTVWIECSGSSQNPLTIQYWAYWAHSSHVNWGGISISGNITYHPNGASGNDTKQIISLGYDQKVAGDIYIRDGYAFLGWNSQADGNGTSYTPGGTYTFNSNTDLYAQWQEKKYVIHYDANGGTGAPSDVTKKWNQTIYISQTVPQRQRFKFTGWNTASNGSGTAYVAGQAYSANDNLTLYAQWTPVYLLTVNPNGGSWNSSQNTVQYWMEHAETKIISDAQRIGYNFKGWKINA